MTPDLVLISPCSGAVRGAAPAGVEAIVHSLAEGFRETHSVRVVATPDSELPQGVALHPCRHAALPAEIARLCARWPGAIVCDHSGAAIDEGSHPRFFRVFHVEPRYVHTPPSARRCGFVSAYLRGLFASERGAPFAGCPVLPNGIPVDAAPRRDGSMDVIYIGRINRLKGIDLGVAACARIGRTLHLFGGLGPGHPADIVFNDLPLLDELASRHPASFVYEGPLSDPGRKRAVLASAAAVVVPSREAESCSLVALEAVAAGAPLVTFRRGGVVDYLPDHPGVFFAEHAGDDGADVSALARALGRALSSRAASALPERYMAPAMVARYRDWFAGRPSSV